MTIPAGVDTARACASPARASTAATAARPGDLYVVSPVEPHERFVREGAHVLSEDEVGYPQAVLGADGGGRDRCTGR